MHGECRQDVPAVRSSVDLSSDDILSPERSSALPFGTYGEQRRS
jgi:hypothetical protein